MGNQPGSHSGLSGGAGPGRTKRDKPACGNFFAIRGFPSGQWPALALFWGYYKLPIPEDLATGAYDLLLMLQDGEAGAPVGKPYLLQEIMIQDDVCHYGPVEDAVNINATFGDQLRLLAYDFEQDDQLDLRLYWQADQRMEDDYKIFVHVFDLETAVPVA